MPGRKRVKRTQNLFIDDQKVYQEIHNSLEAVYKMIVMARHDTGACCGVTKCAVIEFDRGKMVKGERLDVLDERMNALDQDVNEIYRF